uniref:Uncharacterized protein n=1 Tax=Arundo donax TaxID=35708 RepID=A0A0A9HNL4_ARUDO
MCMDCVERMGSVTTLVVLDVDVLQIMRWLIQQTGTKDADQSSRLTTETKHTRILHLSGNLMLITTALICPPISPSHSKHAGTFA